MRRKPFSVVLFDEVEKAHPDIFNSLLQILEDGRLTDSQGRVVDFKNTVIIMTTNLGTRDISKGFNLGFAAQGDAKAGYERMKTKVNDELKQHFRPEFLNRVDDIIVFPQLTEDEIIPIVDIMIAKVDERLQGPRHGHRAHPGRQGRCSPSEGYDPVLGARPLRRTIQREIEDVLVREDPLRRARPRPDRAGRRRGRGRASEVHLPRRGEGRRCRTSRRSSRQRVGRPEPAQGERDSQGRCQQATSRAENGGPGTDTPVRGRRFPFPAPGPRAPATPRDRRPQGGSGRPENPAA